MKAQKRCNVCGLKELTVIRRNKNNKGFIIWDDDMELMFRNNAAGKIVDKYYDVPVEIILVDGYCQNCYHENKVFTG